MKLTAQSDQPRYWPLGQIVLARLREFSREPEAMFWVYGFPLLMMVALGIAFRNQPTQPIALDVAEGPNSEKAVEALQPPTRFNVKVVSEEEGRRRLRTGRTDLLVVSATGGEPKYEFIFDPTHPQSAAARDAADDALQRAAGRTDPATVEEIKVSEPGARYIDFLVPGLLGLGLMGGGLWGVGFVTVDLRIRKLLKRFLATPMRKTDFLAGIMISRMFFMIPEVLLLLLFARIAFGVVIYGSLTAVIFLVILGAVAFSGLGLLIASRAKTLEAVSGLMNLVMLPMWLLSGVFFSSDRFPEFLQPAIKVLPLTALIDSLRAVMQDGASLAAQMPQIGILAAWGIVSFVLALAWFRWI